MLNVKGWKITYIGEVKGLPWWLSSKKKICLQSRKPKFDPWVGKIPWRRAWQLTPVFLPGESHRQSLMGYSPQVHPESQLTQLSRAQGR